MKMISSILALGIFGHACMGAIWPDGQFDSDLNDPNNDAGSTLYKGGSIRDLEHLQHSSLWGHQYVQGGAGEGKQFLTPMGMLANKQQVKTDAVLPAYCDPPNPCPPGFVGDDGCLEEFENTAEFSREYQARQDCLCDEDHMFQCPANHHKASESFKDDVDDIGQLFNTILDKAGIKDQHKTLVAKKFHAKKRRVKRSPSPSMAHVGQWKPNQHVNPYLRGEKLRTVAKKGGKGM